MVMEINLSQGKVTLIDDEDYNRVSKIKWHAIKHIGRPHSWYASGYVNGRLVKLQRFIMGLDKNIDHIDGNGLNNTRANLREATSQQNAWNRRKPRQDYRGKESSKFKGVSKQTQGTTWCCRVVHNYKTYYIGNFKTEQDAAIAYDKWAIGLFGEYAKTNFPVENYLELVV